jgi:hypothetical protein
MRFALLLFCACGPSFTDADLQRVESVHRVLRYQLADCQRGQDAGCRPGDVRSTAMPACANVAGILRDHGVDAGCP